MSWDTGNGKDIPRPLCAYVTDTAQQRKPGMQSLRAQAAASTALLPAVMMLLLTGVLVVTPALAEAMLVT